MQQDNFKLNENIATNALKKTLYFIDKFFCLKKTTTTNEENFI
jgi:hypothetical protein